MLKYLILYRLYILAKAVNLGVLVTPGLNWSLEIVVAGATMTSVSLTTMVDPDVAETPADGCPPGLEATCGPRPRPRPRPPRPLRARPRARWALLGKALLRLVMFIGDVGADTSQFSNRCVATRAAAPPAAAARLRAQLPPLPPR